MTYVDPDTEGKKMGILTEYNDYESFKLKIRDHWYENDHLMVELPCGRVEGIAGTAAIVHEIIDK